MSGDFFYIFQLNKYLLTQGTHIRNLLPEGVIQQRRITNFINLIDELKGHRHEKSVSNKHVGDALGFQYEPLLYLTIF
jgi:hypothetical protein